MLYLGFGALILLVIGVIFGSRFFLSKKSDTLVSTGESSKSASKKHQDVDLGKMSFMYFNVAMVVTVAALLMAFEYKSVNIFEKPVEYLGDMLVMDDTTIQIKEIQPPAPAAPMVKQPEIKIVDDNKKLEEPPKDLNSETDENTDENANTNTGTKFGGGDSNTDYVEPPKETVDEIFTIVEEGATFEGGMSKFYDYVKKNLDYPKSAKKMGVEGKVFVQFVINKDGSVTDVQAIKGIGSGCDEEAVRVVSASPKWTPAKQRGATVRQKMVIPIVFKLK
jgi:protein TonB